MDLTARYDELNDRVFALYEAGRYDEALRVLDTESAGLEDWSAELAQVRACVLAVNGDADGALRALQDASASGAWWRPEILTEDDDLAALRGRAEFEQLVARSGSLVSDDVVPALVDLPDLPDRSAVGVVVALHGAGQTAEHARAAWRAVLDRGHALVCVQSSRRMSPRYFCARLVSVSPSTIRYFHVVGICSFSPGRSGRGCEMPFASITKTP